MKTLFSLPAFAVAASMTTAFSTPVNPTNIALGAPVTASAFWENNPIVAPEKAVDGSTYDQFGGGNFWVLPNVTTGWLQVDLGAPRAIGLIKIINFNDTYANDRATKDFRCEILDGNMAVLYSTSGVLPFTSLSSASNPTVPYLIDLPAAITGRYVKIYVDSWYPTRTDPTWPYYVIPSSNLNNQGGGLNDVQVFEASGIANSAPTVAATGAGSYEIGSTVTLGGDVADVDGDPLAYTWAVDGNTVCSGTVASSAGGTPVTLSPCSAGGLALGNHTAVLTVSDGVNPAVTSTLVLVVVDYTLPTLAPESNPKILWPPNHNMVDVVIDAHAADNGGYVSLAASVSSNEPQEGLGDGDTPVDWQGLSIDQATGRISLQLRAERAGNGSGRTYSVTVTATDGSGNQASTVVKIKVPKSQGK